MKETQFIYDTCNIDFDPYLFPIFKIIIDKTYTTTSDIQEDLQYTQPAITQSLKKLLHKGLVLFKVDELDKRKKIFFLTQKGKDTHQRMIPLWKVIDKQVKDITQFNSTTFTDHITNIEHKFREKSLSKRILEELILNPMNNIPEISIIPFDPIYAKDFASLNVEWLEKYFVVEPHDAELLLNCEETIINKGGHIFFAKVGDDIAGTFSLIKIKEGFYELGKMAVSPKFQGHKIGQQLITFCLDFAKKQHWSKIILYSNRILKNALHIYTKYGFIEVEIEKNSPYQRSDIKMELSLK